MAVLKHQIAYRVKGSLAETEDWWHLCYDTESDVFFVEHEWDHANPYPRGGPGDSGTKRYDAANWDGPGREELAAAKALLLK